MTADERKWLEEFKRINGFDRTPSDFDRTSLGSRALSNDRAQTSPRKGPCRLGNIIGADYLAIIATNHRARAGHKPQTISRFEATPAVPTAGRIGPKAIGSFDTRRLLQRARRGPKATTP